MLTRQTQRLLELQTRRDDYTVYVRPEVVVEVAFDGLQASPRYTPGWPSASLGSRDTGTTKRPEDAHRIDTVRRSTPGGRLALRTRFVGLESFWHLPRNGADDRRNSHTSRRSFGLARPFRE
jgi:hypothetical protein